MRQPHNKLLPRLLMLGATLAVGALGWFLLGESENVIAEETPAETVLARIDGAPITSEEVEAAAAGQLAQLEQQRHELLASTLETQVRQRLLDLEAAERGVTADALLTAEVQGKSAAIPAEEVEAFYQARRGQLRQPLSAVEPQIRRYLAGEAFFRRLKAAHRVEVLMDPFRLAVAADGPAKGPADAPVTIVEFSDFQCPSCKRVGPELEKVEQAYGDKVQIVFRQFPLPIHPRARRAGEASLCAHDQGKFWELHDKLFADQQGLEPGAIEAKAGEIDGLDVAAFSSCLDAGRHAGQVQADVAAGADLGITGTPAFFINGRPLTGAPSFESFAAMIDEELARRGDRAG